MKVKDVDGNELKVVDLDAAIAQVEAFLQYKHSDPGYEKEDEKRYREWKFIYDQLVALKPS